LLVIDSKKNDISQAAALAGGNQHPPLAVNRYHIGGKQFAGLKRTKLAQYL
jgi:hypothetical protein